MPEVGLWHLRLHFGAYEPDALISFIKDKADVAIAVLEKDATRSHIHCVITEFKQTKSTFCQQLLKKFPALAGNQGYSCQKKDDFEAQLRYCCKGESRTDEPFILVCREGIDWRSYHDAYWRENDALRNQGGNMGLQKGTPWEKVKAKNWTERVCDEIEKKYISQIQIIRDYQLLVSPTSQDVNEYVDAQRILFRHFNKCLGVSRKKVSFKIREENFDGIINWIIQTGSEECSDAHSDRVFSLIYGYKYCK